MFRKILLALDGSENAEKAIPWVKRTSGHPVAQVVLFQAVREENLSLDEVLRHEKEAQDYLLRIEREFNYAGIPAKVLVRPGNPAQSIIDAAIEDKCEVIVMTTRGGAKIDRWIVGGVTEQVMRLSPIPVIVVRSRTRMPRQKRVLRIVVPIDGSTLAEAVIPWAEQMARFFHARIALLHVRTDFGRTNLNLSERLRRRMAALGQALRKKGVKSEFKVRVGDPADRILGFTRAGDLIATTTHGAGGFKRWIFGSVAEKLIHQDRVPVAIYKTRAQVADRPKKTGTGT